MVYCLRLPLDQCGREESAKQHRIAIVIPAGPVARISDAGDRFGQAIFEEFRRLGDVEGQNLTVERYSGEGRPEGYADLAREVVNRNPDVIVAITDAIAKAARAAADTTPIVWVGGDPIQAGLATSLARPGGNITGVTVYVGIEIWGKRLQILKEAVPSASNAAFLTTRTSSAFTEEQLREISHIGEIATVCGVVASAKYEINAKSQPTLLDPGKAYPNAVFTTVVYGENRAKFGTTKTSLRGKRICVTGKISAYQGKPEIVLTDPSQLTE